MRLGNVPGNLATGSASVHGSEPVDKVDSGCRCPATRFRAECAALRRKANMPASHILLAVLVQIFWGATYPLCKPYVDVFPPMMLVAMVYSIVALVSAPFVPRPSTPQRTLFLLGFFGGALQTSMVFVALKYLPASTAV